MFAEAEILMIWLPQIFETIAGGSVHRAPFASLEPFSLMVDQRSCTPETPFAHPTLIVVRGVR
jgi:hypothetical protein